MDGFTAFLIGMCGFVILGFIVIFMLYRQKRHHKDGNISIAKHKLN